MAGNMYGTRGGPTKEQIANNTLEQTIIKCLSNNMGTKFPEYGAYSENHSTFTPGNLSSRRMLPTRNITVRLGRPDSAYRIRYDTATKIHSVTKPSMYSHDLPDEDLNNILKCITTSLQQGGKRRRSKKQTKRTSRKNKSRKH